MDVRRDNISFICLAPAKEDEHGIRMNEDQHAFFDKLYQLYYPRVLAYLRFRVGTMDIAEDLTSLVFERALTHIGELQASEAAAARGDAQYRSERTAEHPELDAVVTPPHGAFFELVR